MGLLDDAIREHLELKKRHGADPSEVARQEREALGPVRGAATEAAAPPAEAPAATEPEPAVEPPEDDPRLDPFVDPDATDLADLTAAEPAEPLDAPPAPPPPPRRAEPPGAVPSERFAPEPDLDWSDPAPAPAAEPDAAADGEDPEDVLEETPEFLEETPEHDRLWFEQRPPKDFDF